MPCWGIYLSRWRGNYSRRELICPMRCLMRLQIIFGTYNTSSRITFTPFVPLTPMLSVPSAASLLLLANLILYFLLESKLVSHSLCAVMWLEQPESRCHSSFLTLSSQVVAIINTALWSLPLATLASPSFCWSFLYQHSSYYYFV
jgi:hypothetical protein